MLSIKKIQETRAQKRKGFSFMEILVALIMSVSMSVGAFFTYSDAQQTRKMAQMHSDMDAIVTGLLTYEALSIDATLPASLEVLATGLTATQSVDGLEHKNIVTSIQDPEGKGTFKTPWGGDYTYSNTARTLTCTPDKADGTAMDKAVVRQF